mgnify:CR=1 FL=1
MKPINTPFELNIESMIKRNNEMYKHFNQLNSIKNRKNLYLPKIKIQKNIFSPKNKSKNFSLLSIERENQKFNCKINEINMRKNKNKINMKLINELLKQKKTSREKSRKIELALLTKTNNQFLNRIKNVHPIINHKKLNLQYLESRRVYNISRKLKPCFSWGNSCFTKEDYSYMEKYGNVISARNKSLNDSTNEILKINKIKFIKLGQSKSATKIKIK